MFKGKESSNRIELSRLVRLIEFWCFGLPAALGVGGLGRWGWGVVGGCPPHMCTCTCTHAHACTCMHGKHDNSMQMAAPIRFGEIPGIPYDVICACGCVRVRVHMCRGDPVTTPHPHPPIPQGGEPPESVKIQ